MRLRALWLKFQMRREGTKKGIKFKSILELVAEPVNTAAGVVKISVPLFK